MKKAAPSVEKENRKLDIMVSDLRNAQLSYDSNIVEDEAVKLSAEQSIQQVLVPFTASEAELAVCKSLLIQTNEKKVSAEKQLVEAQMVVAQLTTEVDSAKIKVNQASQKYEELSVQLEAVRRKTEQGLDERRRAREDQIQRLETLKSEVEKQRQKVQSIIAGESPVVMLLGQPGDGKSTVGNIIAGKEVFPTGCTGAAVSRVAKSYFGPAFNDASFPVIGVLDSPGLNDVDPSLNLIAWWNSFNATLRNDGIHHIDAVIIVLNASDTRLKLAHLIALGMTQKLFKLSKSKTFFCVSHAQDAEVPVHYQRRANAYEDMGLSVDLENFFRFDFDINGNLLPDALVEMQAMVNKILVQCSNSHDESFQVTTVDVQVDSEALVSDAIDRLADQSDARNMQFELNMAKEDGFCATQ